MKYEVTDVKFLNAALLCIMYVFIVTEKLPSGRCPPINPPWVRIRVWVRVRVGGNFPGGKFPCTRVYIVLFEKIITIVDCQILSVLIFCMVLICNLFCKRWTILGNRHCVKSVQIRSFFWSVFSRIRTEYGEMLRISLYSVRMRENTDQKKLPIWTLFTQ